MQQCHHCTHGISYIGNGNSQFVYEICVNVIINQCWLSNMKDVTSADLDAEIRATINCHSLSACIVVNAIIGASLTEPTQKGSWCDHG